MALKRGPFFEVTLVKLPPRIWHNKFRLFARERERIFVFLLTQPITELCGERFPKRTAELLDLKQIPTTLIHTAFVSSLELLEITQGEAQRMGGFNHTIMFIPFAHSISMTLFTNLVCLIESNQFRSGIHIGLFTVNGGVLIVHHIINNGIMPSFPNITHDPNRFVASLNHNTLMGDSGHFRVFVSGVNSHS